MKNVVDFTYSVNYQQLSQNEYYQELPPNIRKKLHHVIFQNEEVQFKHLFSRQVSEDHIYHVKQEVMHKLLSRIEIELIIDE